MEGQMTQEGEGQEWENNESEGGKKRETQKGEGQEGQKKGREGGKKRETRKGEGQEGQNKESKLGKKRERWGVYGGRLFIVSARTNKVYHHNYPVGVRGVPYPRER